MTNEQINVLKHISNVKSKVLAAITFAETEQNKVKELYENGVKKLPANIKGVPNKFAKMNTNHQQLIEMSFNDAQKDICNLEFRASIPKLQDGVSKVMINKTTGRVEFGLPYNPRIHGSKDTHEYVKYRDTAHFIELLNFLLNYVEELERITPVYKNLQPIEVDIVFIEPQKKIVVNNANTTNQSTPKKVPQPQAIQLITADTSYVQKEDEEAEVEIVKRWDRYFIAGTGMSISMFPQIVDMLKKTPINGDGKFLKIKLPQLELRPEIVEKLEEISETKKRYDKRDWYHYAKFGLNNPAKESIDIVINGENHVLQYLLAQIQGNGVFRKRTKVDGWEPIETFVNRIKTLFKEDKIWIARSAEDALEDLNY